MSSTTCSNILLVLFAILVLYAKEARVATDAIAPSSPGKAKFPALIAFGDSILDTGSNNLLISAIKSNFPPYGRDFPGGVATGRFGNGKVLSDLIMEGLGIKPTIPAFLDPNLQNDELATGVNFASAGSGLDKETATILNVVHITEQFNNFKRYITRLEGVVGSEKAKQIISDSLFLISSGNNDIGLTYFILKKSLFIDLNSYTTQLVTSASSFIKNLHGLEARKFAYLSTITVGCTPIVRTVGGFLRGCAEEYNQAAELFNSKLEDELRNLNSSLDGVKIASIDIFNPLLDIVKNPSKFDFEDVTNGCCGTGLLEFAYICNELNPFTCRNSSDHVFWDGAHPTERAYRIIVPGIVGKISKQLLDI